MDINGLEFFVLVSLGRGRCCWALVLSVDPALSSISVLGASVVVPILGSTTAVVLVLGRLTGTAPRQHLPGDLDRRAAPVPMRQ